LKFDRLTFRYPEEVMASDEKYGIRIKFGKILDHSRWISVRMFHETGEFVGSFYQSTKFLARLLRHTVKNSFHPDL
jgi:hypothetical protein